MGLVSGKGYAALLDVQPVAVYTLQMCASVTKPLSVLWRSRHARAFHCTSGSTNLYIFLCGSSVVLNKNKRYKNKRYMCAHVASCPGQRNRRRPVPVPVTGVRYNSLL